MQAYIRTDYITICSVNASKETVESIVEEIAESIQREALIESLGIDIGSILDGNQF